MRVSQADLAEYLDVSRSALSQATKQGHKCGGYPVRAWAVFDGAGRVAAYDVPKRVFQRQNPAPSYVEAQNGQVKSEEGLGLSGHPVDMMPGGSDLMGGTSWPEAVGQNATPVAGTAGGTIATAKFLEVLNNHPATLSSYMLDLGFPIIAAVIGVYATTEETDLRLLKVGLFAIGGWATIRTVRAIVQRWEREASATQEPLPSGQASATDGT